MGSWNLPEHRLAFCRAELLANGFSSDPCDSLTTVAEELAYAIFTPVHEGKQPSYGAIVLPKWDQFNDSFDNRFDGSVLECADTNGRASADGQSSFFVRDLSDDEGFVWLSRSDRFDGEDSLFTLRDEVLFGTTE